VADGALLGEHEAAAARLASLLAGGAKADAPEVVDLAARVGELEAALDGSRVTFRFRGVGRNAFKRLVAGHTSEDGGSFDPTTFPPALVAACSLDPRMTVAEVQQLADDLTDGQFDVLFGAAWDACQAADDSVPFSVPASMIRG